MTSGSTGTARKSAPVYVVVDRELALAAPVEHAWPHVLNYKSWQNYSSAQHISGEPGQDGEVVLLSKEGVSLPFYARTILLEPERRVIWKVYSAEPAYGNEFFGIVEFHVNGNEGGTNLRIHAVYEFSVPYETKAELDGFRKQQAEAGEVMRTLYFPRLKQLVDGSA